MDDTSEELGIADNDGCKEGAKDELDALDNNGCNEGIKNTDGTKVSANDDPSKVEGGTDKLGVLDNDGATDTEGRNVNALATKGCNEGDALGGSDIL
eukprot:CAMPEP_0172520222 /NCGR_PEP_ID=MMETSP1066-20121228/291877_1 /TAXON_ID=671091 /ORGANISM="Coscinodiscus wailesii, Strain CCMP2513" /LENGTH=96 /DNA_ID=CAMNT_0013302945 /DNA_START=496 /DNA_END=786 /DNA_ORIENTATION=+